MRSIKLRRESSFVGYIETLNVRVNGVDFKVYSGSELQISIDEQISNFEVELNSWLLRRKYCFQSDASELTLSISPIVSWKLLFTSLSFLLALGLCVHFSQDKFISFVFNIYGLTWLLAFLALNTIARKYLYHIQIR